jgi:hypothetical protein
MKGTRRLNPLGQLRIATIPILVALAISGCLGDAGLDPAHPVDEEKDDPEWISIDEEGSFAAGVCVYFLIPIQEREGNCTNLGGHNMAQVYGVNGTFTTANISLEWEPNNELTQKLTLVVLAMNRNTGKMTSLFSESSSPPLQWNSDELDHFMGEGDSLIFSIRYNPVVETPVRIEASGFNQSFRLTGELQFHA